jgi:DNA-binding MarR family transcriptional regulator
MVAAFWSVFLTALGALLFPRLAGIGAVSLYARLVQSQMERHPRRAVVLGLIRSEPGVNVASLERQSGISGGVLRHHLDQLESHGLVRRVHSGRATHWFPATGLPVTAPPTLAQRRVLEVLGQAPGITVREVAVRLDVTVQNAWKQLRRLDANRMVRSERAGRATRWAVFA